MTPPSARMCVLQSNNLPSDLTKARPQTTGLCFIGKFEKNKRKVFVQVFAAAMVGALFVFHRHTAPFFKRWWGEGATPFPLSAGGKLPPDPSRISFLFTFATVARQKHRFLCRLYSRFTGGGSPPLAGGSLVPNRHRILHGEVSLGV